MSEPVTGRMWPTPIANDVSDRPLSHDFKKLSCAVHHPQAFTVSPQLTLFAEAFPASRTPSLVDVPDRKMNVTSGRTSFVSSPNCDHDTSCSRTSPASSPRPMPDMTDAAYAAGLVDGEGCLMLSKDLGPVLFVGMTIKARAVLEQMAARWGGNVALKRKATAKWEAACMWRISAADTLQPFLEAILPFLRLKGPQVELLLRVFDLKAECPHRSDGRAVFSPEMRARLETIRLTIQHLNRKGPTTEMPATACAQLVAGQWVTNQRDFFSETGLAPYCETWPRAGSMQSGIIYPQVPLAPLTDGTECGSWPTPDASMGTGGRTSKVAPTGTRPSGSKQAITLNDAAKWWPTPRAEYDSGRHRGKPDTLHSAVKAWPTPTANCVDMDTMERQRVAGYTRKSLREAGTPYVTQTTGMLNPTWVEWLMGYPLEWTALEDWGTASSRRLRNGSRGASSTRKR